MTSGNGPSLDPGFLVDNRPYVGCEDPCGYCHWPIDFSMGVGLNVAVRRAETGFRWMHSVCADYVRGWDEYQQALRDAGVLS